MLLGPLPTPLSQAEGLAPLLGAWRWDRPHTERQVWALTLLAGLQDGSGPALRPHPPSVDLCSPALLL